MTSEQAPPSSHPIPFEQLERCVLPIFVVRPDAKWFAIGSAFVVATLDARTALLMTATHNIQHVVALRPEGPRSHATLPPDFAPTPSRFIDLRGLDIHVIVGRRDRTTVANVVGCWFRGDVDVALMLVELPVGAKTGERFDMRVPLDTSPYLTPGTRIVAVGYPRMDVESSSDYERKVYTAKVRVEIAYATGSIVSLAAQGNGSTIKAPGFFADCTFQHGMSGGPVFLEKNGRPVACGVIGADLTQSEEGVSAPSGRAFASLLWPAAALIETNIAPVMEGQTEPAVIGASILDLIRLGIIEDLGRAHEHVSVRQDGDLRHAQWNRKPPGTE